MAANDLEVSGDGGEAVALDHWIYGRPATEGYRVMAMSEGLNLGMYEGKILGHYTPIRGIVSDSVDRKTTDLRMVHPVSESDEITLSVLKPGLPDEAGRDTYVNHTVVIPISLLSERRLSLDMVDAALKEWDTAHPGVTGKVEPIVIPLASQSHPLPSPGDLLKKFVSKVAVENLVRRWVGGTDLRTLLYCPHTEDDVRKSILYNLLEVMCFAGKLKVPVVMTEAPPPSQLGAFHLVIAGKGVRGDQRWALIEGTTDRSDGPRLPNIDAFYGALDQAYRAKPKIVSIPGAGGRPPPSSTPHSGGTTAVPAAPPAPPPKSEQETGDGDAPAPSEDAPAPPPVAPSPSSPSTETKPAGTEVADGAPSASAMEPEPAASPESPLRPPTLEQAHERVKLEFATFVGNRGAVERISVDLVSALLNVPPQLPSSYLITGNPSVGKTTLARTMSKALGLPLVVLDGQGVADRETLVSAIDASLRAAGLRRKTLPQAPQGITEYEYPPVLVFLDELQLVPRKTQESLLTLTDPETRYVRLDDGIYHFPFATFVAATTRPQSVDSALRSRFSPEIHLLDYSQGEVAQIIASRYPDFPMDICQRLATLGQLIPRVALRLARDLQTRQKVSLEKNKSLMEHLRELEAAEGLDDRGFGPLHGKVLRILQAQNGPVGLEQLLNILGERDRLYVEREVLAGLQRAGFLITLPTGRAITPEGTAYLEHAPSKSRESTGGGGAGTTASGWPLQEPLCVVQVAGEVGLWRWVRETVPGDRKLLCFTHQLRAQVLGTEVPDGVNVLQLSRVEGENMVSPSDVDRIGSFMEQHFTAGTGGLVVLAGLETVVEAAGIGSVRRLLDVGRDLAQQSRGSLLVSMDPARLKPEELKSLGGLGRQIVLN